jgi:hypothetical protein
MRMRGEARGNSSGGEDSGIWVDCDCVEGGGGGHWDCSRSLWSVTLTHLRMFGLQFSFGLDGIIDS